MHATGYLEARPRNPVALGAAITLNLAAVAAMLAYTTEIIPHGPEGIPTIEIRPIPTVKPVERPKTERQRPTDARPEPRPSQIDSHVKIETTDFPQTQWPPLPPEPFPESAGETAKPPLPVPVETAAAFDTRFLANLQPPYPAALERAEIEGKVTVRVQIGTDGRVTVVELVRADDPAFFATTRDQALRRWRFRPAMRDGQPVVSWLTRTVAFKMPRN